MYSGEERRKNEYQPQELAEAMLVIDSLRNENEKLRNQIKYDAKTGLLSSDYLEQECRPYLDSAKQQYDSLSSYEKQSAPLHLIVFIDLNNLKHINESQGYAAGDMAIKKVGTSVSSVLRDGDLLFRVNTAGDEFLAVIRLTKDIEHFDTAAKRILERIKQQVLGDSGENLSVAAGYSWLENAKDFNDSKTIAENKMRTDKINQKKIRNRIGIGLQ